MKNRFLILSLLPAAVLLSSCQEKISETDATPEEYVINISSDASFENETKAPALITTVPANLYWGATAVGVLSESVKYNEHLSSASPVTSGRIYTGKFQTAVPSPYKWYVANFPFSFEGTSDNVTDVTINLSDAGELDVIAGKSSSDNSYTPSVTLKHVTSSIGEQKFNTQENYTVSDISWSITKKQDQKYSIVNDSYTSSGNSEKTAFSPDKFYLPGERIVTITYTLHRENYKETLTRSGNVILKAGCINNLTATATGGNAVFITVSTVSLTDWNNADKEFVL